MRQRSSPRILIRIDIPALHRIEQFLMEQICARYLPPSTETPSAAR